MEEIDFTLMLNLAEEVEREHEGLLPFTEMVNILLAKYYAAKQSAQADKCPDCGGDLWDKYCAICHREFTPRR